MGLQNNRFVFRSSIVGITQDIMKFYHVTTVLLASVAHVRALDSQTETIGESQATSIFQSVGEHFPSSHPPPPPFWKRDDSPPKCSLSYLLSARAAAAAQSSDGSAARRSFYTEENVSNYTEADEVVRRTMPLPRPRIRDMQKYYEAQLVPNAFVPIVFAVPAGEKTNFNTAVYIDIGGATAQTLAVNILCGCTTLIIASRTGVYGAHYWENLAFAIDDAFEVSNGGDYNDQEDAFVRTVIQGLQSGVQGQGSSLYPGTPEQVSLSDVAPRIIAGAGPNPATDNKIKAYLIFPTQSWEEKKTPYAEYQAKFNRIKTTVGEIIPALQWDPVAAVPNPLWTDIPYVPVSGDDRELLGKSWHGVVMFKYDPDHNDMKKAALWVENDSTDRHNDQWV